MDIQSIDWWQAIQMVVMEMTRKQCCWITKYTIRFCAMGHIRAQRNVGNFVHKLDTVMQEIS